jgi:proline iminopeptidase
MISAYYDQLTSDNPEIRRTASMAWSRWEGRTVTLLPAADIEMQHTDALFADAFARIECHYFINQGFFDDPNYILSRADALGCIPIDIVHGRYDIVCPLQNAWDLHRAAPHSRLHIIEGAGHSATEPAIQESLVAICERVKNEIASS